MPSSPRQVSDKDIVVERPKTPPFEIEPVEWTSPLSDSFFFMINLEHKLVKKCFVNNGKFSSVDIIPFDSNGTTREEIIEDARNFIIKNHYHALAF